MSLVNCRKKELQKIGYTDFQEWNACDSNIYIGRNMNFYVKGAYKSKWHNPYSSKKYGLDECLRLYEIYLEESGLINDIDELSGKQLGCWCYPNRCHGDILLNALEKIEK